MKSKQQIQTSLGDARVVDGIVIRNLFVERAGCAEMRK